MSNLQLHAALETALTDRRLLTHPFYQRWCRGELSVSDLRAYAEQYRFFEAELPGALGRIRDRAGDGGVQTMVQRNLDDELGVTGTAHLDLFERFADELAADREAAPSTATVNLISTYRALVDESPQRGLAAVLAYEAQASEIAESKAAGLKTHYAMGGEAVEFWTVHATADVEHARWALEALAALGATPDAVRSGARAAADAWWAFLDEREAAC
ncbi:MAG TPA: iron-containing redox enzyme family protein [Candidatus Dormibacteraeota bacterium]